MLLGVYQQDLLGVYQQDLLGVYQQDLASTGIITDSTPDFFPSHSLSLSLSLSF